MLTITIITIITIIHIIIIIITMQVQERGGVGGFGDGSIAPSSLLSPLPAHLLVHLAQVNILEFSEHLLHLLHLAQVKLF